MNDLIGANQHLPHWVYELIGRDGSHVYIGCTCNLGARLGAHRSQPWWSEVARVEVDVFPSQRAGLDVERERIERHGPKYNSIFTDGHDAGGWANRRRKMAEAHAEGRPCDDRSCHSCDKLAHSLRVTCSQQYRCSVCRTFLPLEYMDNAQDADCWRELAQRHGGEYATLACEAVPAPIDALAADEQGVSADELKRGFLARLRPSTGRRSA